MIAAILLAAAQACTPQATTERCATQPGAAWRATATNDDRERLRKWRDAWDAAVGPDRVALTPYGPLLEPDRALDRPVPPAGAYRCRTIKLGTRGGAGGQVAAQAAASCRIEADGDRLTLRQADGAQRPVGTIFADTPARGIFLGTLQLGDERAALAYGQDRTRDMAGIVERVADRRWRIVLPYPAFESMLDVIELEGTD